MNCCISKGWSFTHWKERGVRLCPKDLNSAETGNAIVIPTEIKNWQDGWWYSGGRRRGSRTEYLPELQKLVLECDAPIPHAEQCGKVRCLSVLERGSTHEAFWVLFVTVLFKRRMSALTSVEDDWVGCRSLWPVVWRKEASRKPQATQGTMLIKAGAGRE